MPDLDFFGDPLTPSPPPVQRPDAPHTEAWIQATLLSGLRKLPNCHAFRVSVLYSDDAHRSAVPRGTPDVYCRLRGKAIWIENKTVAAAAALDKHGPRTKTEKAQAKWRAREEAAGGTVLRCTDPTATIAQLLEITGALP